MIDFSRHAVKAFSKDEVYEEDYGKVIIFLFY